ncbi:hypothetical protein MBRU_15845 [Mycolicibacterium brumae DSM 44177]|nr:hypothetical protein MBRU_15845 [Mycolicibacterium brumae DSM 44177]
MIDSLSGYSGFSMVGENGACTSGAVCRRIGARSPAGARSAIAAQISAAAPAVRFAGSTTSRWPVARTDAAMVSTSSGATLKSSHGSLNRLKCRLARSIELTDTSDADF